jgi:hypothetical protein
VVQSSEVSLSRFHLSESASPEKFLAIDQGPPRDRAAARVYGNLRLRGIDPDVGGGDAAGDFRWLENPRHDPEGWTESTQCDLSAVALESTPTLTTPSFPSVQNIAL